jgi:hypothetical protein
MGIEMSEEPGFIIKFYDKAYEEKNILELVEAPVEAISGVSETDAELLKESFNIETVMDFATNEYITLAQAVNNFSQCSGSILDQEFNSKDFIELSEKPVHAIKGISEEDAERLQKAFNIKTIMDLAQNKYVSIAQTTVSLAALVEVLLEMSES